MNDSITDSFLEDLFDGDSVAVARAITMVEDRSDGYRKLLKAVYPRTGDAHIVGITGPPGSGKSTLADQLAGQYQDLQQSLGIVAVDPSSPYSGGSVLGDRVRFGERSHMNEVFYRSMSSRGTAGGLAGSTDDVIRILDAAGFDNIIVETVGAGQNEVEIVRTADTVIVVLMPGTGDGVQMLKAGILEIGDIFVVNKMDKQGVDRTVMNLKGMIRNGSDGDDDNTTNWDIPVEKTEATSGKNIGELKTAIEEHRSYLSSSEKLEERRARRKINQFERILQDNLREQVNEIIETRGGRDRLHENLIDRDEDPYSLVEQILNQM